jgi:hypothetical protein
MPQPDPIVAVPAIRSMKSWRHRPRRHGSIKRNSVIDIPIESWQLQRRRRQTEPGQLFEGIGGHVPIGGRLSYVQATRDYCRGGNTHRHGSLSEARRQSFAANLHHERTNRSCVKLLVILCTCLLSRAMPDSKNPPDRADGPCRTRILQRTMRPASNRNSPPCRSLFPPQRPASQCRR